MKKILLYVMVLLGALSCAKKAEYDQTLGLMSKYNVLSKDGGSTQVAVFSNTSWTVEMDRQVDWASIDRFNGYKCGYLVFDYETNYGRARRVILVFKAGDETRTLNMYQSGSISDSDCELDLTVNENTINATAAGLLESIPFKTNLIFQLDEMYLTLTYPEGEEPATPWITLKSVELDNIVVEIAPNTTGAPRTANMRLTHTDAGSYDSTEGDSVYSNTISVVQTQ